ncbi:MAG TPA: molybdopterin molybdotransferase MoeA [Candidatus Bathyarchaeia archaeon]|nr:molybdopterin molybdotransferase MoeA [Candidatus Bathyarchaeia archaeon]
MTFKPIKYLSIGAAYNRLRQNISVRPQAERVMFLKSYGRVLSDDLISHVDIPMYDSSNMDGFAVLANDIKHASISCPINLKIIRDIGLGNFPGVVLHSGQAYRISTGGYLPKGTDTVVPIESTQQVLSKDNVRILASLPIGSFVSPLGKDVRKKSVLLRRGNVIRGQDVALLAMVSIFRVPVFRKPRVAIIPTGDELTDNPNEIKGPTAKIMNTNSHIISRFVQEGGGVPLDLGVTPDNVKKVAKKIRLALEKTDMILTTAGSSVGEYDVVEQSIDSLGRPGVLAHGVKLDRGRVAGVAVLKGKPIIILPGPVQGAVNAFIIFAGPILRYLSGLPEFDGLRIVGTLTKKWEARKKFSKFTKIAYVSAWSSKDGNVKATPITGDTAMMTVMTKANGYLLLPEMTTAIEAGEKVYINVLPGLSYASGLSTNFLRRRH